MFENKVFHRNKKIKPSSDLQISFRSARSDYRKRSGREGPIERRRRKRCLCHHGDPELQGPSSSAQPSPSLPHVVFCAHPRLLQLIPQEPLGTVESGSSPQAHPAVQGMHHCRADNHWWLPAGPAEHSAEAKGSLSAASLFRILCLQNLGPFLSPYTGLKRGVGKYLPSGHNEHFNF